MMCEWFSELDRPKGARHRPHQVETPVRVFNTNSCTPHTTAQLHTHSLISARAARAHGQSAA